ncbi:MAG: hypothetical protein WBM40_14745 [Thiohalocapsa sp.]
MCSRPRPGEDFVRFHAYRFNPEAVACLMRELRDFVRKGSMLAREDLGIGLQVDFLSLVDVDALTPNPVDEHVGSTSKP